MRTIHKTKEQLMSEVAELRQRVAELEKAEAERKRAEEALRESEETLRAIVENAPDAIFIHDLMGNFVDGNRKAEELIGYSKEELIGKNFFEAGLIPEARVLDVIAGLEQSRRGEIGKRCELELITKQGSRVYVEIAGLAIAGKENVQVLGFARDITERKRVEEEVQRNSKRVEALYAISQAVSHTLNLDELLNEALGRVLEVMDTDVGGIYLLDLQARVFILRAQIGVSEETIACIGVIKLEEQEIKRGLEWQEPVFEPDRVFSETNVAKVAAAMENERAQAHIIVPFWSKGMLLGALVIADHREHQFTTEDIDLVRAIGNQIAVGIENARLLERTIELSVTDELTGLYNCRHFWEMLGAEVGRTQRYAQSFSLVMLDIDGFKEYNDRFGHTNGDAVLRSLAQTVKSELRKSDTAFRYGGDEFTIILPATDAYRAKTIIERIRSKWLQTPKTQYPTLGSPLRFSAGIAQFPENAETADGLAFLADAALYHAKRVGGYGVMLVSDIETLALDIQSMATLEQVYALAAMVDTRDPYTYNHSKRVAAVVERIVKALGLSGQESSDLYAASLLHDIGKVGVPDSILTKPSRLTEDEWRIIRRHSAEGAKILGYAGGQRGSVKMILHHHEWYDGRGYPDGLKGEEIPLGARIISLADAYDTMTTPRLYRDVVSHEEACEELRRHSGNQFDPEVVEAFCQITSDDDRQG